MAFCKKCGTKIEDDAAFCVGCGTPVTTSAPTVNLEKVEPEYKTMIRKKQVYGVVNIENMPEGHIVDDRYEVISKLGQGGFGAVYHVLDKKLEIEKALKIMPDAITSDIEAMGSLRKEAITMVKLNHPNIVRVFDFHDKGDIKYIDMEYVDGKSLSDLKLDSPDGKLSERKVLDMAVQMAQGFSYAHSENVIHRDIKPQNILLSKNGEIKIMDFGISETVKNSMSRISNTGTSGTLIYMSPEQIQGKNVGNEADIYSFGVLIYELLSGKPPFNKGDISYQVMNEKPEPLHAVSATANMLVMRCLEKDYTHRYPSFREIQTTLGGDTTNEIVVGIDFVQINPGSFNMGSNGGEASEKPVHKVTLSKGFFMQTTVVTQGQWASVMGTRPWAENDFVKEDKSAPAVMISWNDCQAFIKKLNSREGENKYRLPTEAEWEFAARAGSSQDYCFGYDQGLLDEYAWYDRNTVAVEEQYPHPVALKKPNQFGLFDMHGNVWEMCEDWFGKYPVEDVADPVGPLNGSYRIYRGGCWNRNVSNCRVSSRFVNTSVFKFNNIGFRLGRNYM